MQSSRPLRPGVREHHAPVGALRQTAQGVDASTKPVREHHAPVGALRRFQDLASLPSAPVREHHAPVGALRHDGCDNTDEKNCSQGAPRTCRCIETGPVTYLISPMSCQGAPRTCRCIETVRLCRAHPPPYTSGSTTHLQVHWASLARNEGVRGWSGAVMRRNDENVVQARAVSACTIPMCCICVSSRRPPIRPRASPMRERLS